MKILAIETSCDETGVALLEASGGLRAPKFTVLKNLVASQIKLHAPFGGVVPNLAKREHQKNLPILYRKIFGKGHMAYGKESNHKPLAISHKLDLITVTVGPGLEPALWAGITFAQELAKQYDVPLVGANHLEGHLYSFLLSKQKKTATSNFQLPISKVFPAVALIVSGGHTILLLVKDLVHWKKLGETQDDAVGEAFDKVARMLELPYPGGPEIERIAKISQLKAKSLIPFPRPMLHHKNYDFSFSGLKTAVLYYLKENVEWKKRHGVEVNRSSPPINHSTLPNHLAADVAASFQQAAIEVLIAKTMRATREYGARSVMLSGGVAANKALQSELRHATRKMGVQFLVAPAKYNTDNAVMIGIAGYFTHLRKKRYKLEAQGNLSI